MGLVLITNLESDELLAQMTSKLGRAGHTVQYEGVHPGWLSDRMRKLLPGMDAVIAGGDEYPANVLAEADRLKVLARVGIGYDLVDTEYATAHGILVTNTPGVSTDSVADMALALLLAITRSLVPQVLATRSGEYQPLIGPELTTQTLGLLGCGRIGSAVARRALGFGMRVLAHDPAPSSGALPVGVESVSRDELLQSADVVSLHIPLSPDTRGSIDAAFLAAMKPGSFLVNTARGGLVDERALINALDSGQIAGAGIDVLGSEPPVGISRALLGHPSVLATPHSAGYTHEAELRGALLAVEAVNDGLAGRRPSYLLNPSAFGELGSTSRD